MKYNLFIALIFSFSLTKIAHAAQWNKSLGEYQIVSPTNVQGGLVLQAADGSGIFPLAFGPAWTSDFKTLKVYFSCEGARCIYPGGGFSPMSLTFKDNGDVVFEQNVTFILRKVGQNNAPPASAWTFKEYSDSSQILYTASQSDKNSGATLVASCNAKSEQVNWAIRLSEKSYLTVQGAVLYAKAELKTDGKVDNLKSQTSQWNVADNRYITAKQSTPFNLSDLKTGSQVSMTLVAVKSDGTEVSLEKMNFSLKGSTAALNKLQVNCSPNSNSDLPIPLP